MVNAAPSAAPVRHTAKELLRIDPVSVQEDLKVAVGAGSAAGSAQIADGLTLADHIAVAHRMAGHVSIEGHIAIAVVNDDIVAVTVIIGRGYNRDL